MVSFFKLFIVNRKIISRLKSRMDLIPKLAILSDSKCVARETFHPFSSQNITRGTGLCPKLSREVATRGESIEVQAGIRSRKRVWSAPPSSTVLARETILYKKEHTLEKRKVPSVCTQRTHETGKQSGKRSLIFSSPSSLLYPFALNLYAWNEIFLKLFSTDLRRRSHWTMETTPRTTAALIRIIQFEIGRSTVSRRMIVPPRIISSCILSEAIFLKK